MHIFFISLPHAKGDPLLPGPGDLRLHLRPGGPEHRPLRRHPTPDELWRLLEEGQGPGGGRLGALRTLLSAHTALLRDHRDGGVRVGHFLKIYRFFLIFYPGVGDAGN